MTIEELQSLSPGTKIVYVFGSGEHEQRHRAKVLEHTAGWTGVLVYFTTKPQAKLRWSTATNRPIGTKSHTGIVRLEQ
ncbi:MAG: hypothetical protein JWN66_551 [Sphingomonas bacterium]|uniref:hypothetical protein n=1 Tax=Sphingomonas bacterium TaxID=1895847 RepID=UPI0026235EB2|nr:hypothetical protein [Sphingomonas bacterium]MDB5703435.1 hypothetical protein [Sphingomonas bacterium]